MSVAFVDNASATFFPVGSCGGGSSGSSGSSSPCYTYNEGVQPTTSRSTSFANMEPARHAPRWGRRVSRRGKGSLLTHLLIFFLFLTSLMVLLQVWLMLPPGLNAAAPRQPGRGFLPPAGSRKWPAAAAAAAAAAAVAVGATAGAAAAAGKGTTAGTEGEEEEEEEEEEKVNKYIAGSLANGSANMDGWAPRGDVGTLVAKSGLGCLAGCLTNICAVTIRVADANDADLNRQSRSAQEVTSAYRREQLNEKAQTTQKKYISSRGGLRFSRRRHSYLSRDGVRLAEFKVRAALLQGLARLGLWAD